MSPALPELIELTREGSLRARLRLRLPPELPQFQGHFPGFPVLPAVAQIDWAIHYAAELFGIQVAFQGMQRLKFRQVLLPGDEPELALEFDSDRGTLEFSYVTSRGRHSAGQLLITD